MNILYDDGYGVFFEVQDQPYLGDDGVRLVNELLQGAKHHGGATELINALAFLLVLLLARLDRLLVREVLFLDQEQVLEALEAKLAELALDGGRDGGKLVDGLGALLLLLLADAHGLGGHPLLLLLYSATWQGEREGGRGGK